MTDQPILLAGDLHGDETWLFQKLVPTALAAGVGRIIALGDFGMFWDSAAKPKRVGDKMAQVGLDLWFLDGNHENFDSMMDMGFDPDAGTDPIYNDYLNLTYIPRGATFEWGGKTFMGFGGAVSIDKEWRTEHLSWWADELITEGQVRRVEDNPTEVDILLSHDVAGTPPVLGDFLRRGYDLPYKMDQLSRQNREMLRRVFDAVHPSWNFHGHYHHSYQDRLDMCTFQGLACNGMAGAYTILRDGRTDEQQQEQAS